MRYRFYILAALLIPLSVAAPASAGQYDYDPASRPNYAEAKRIALAAHPGVQTYCPTVTVVKARLTDDALAEAIFPCVVRVDPRQVRGRLGLCSTLTHEFGHLARQDGWHSPNARDNMHATSGANHRLCVRQERLHYRTYVLRHRLKVLRHRPSTARLRRLLRRAQRRLI